MKRESLYFEIGNIDDDLIEEACIAQGYKKRRMSFLRCVGAAACLCLICAAAAFWQSKDSIHFNMADAFVALKVYIPNDADADVLCEEELFDYYGIEPFPEVIFDMRRFVQSEYFVYYDAGDAVYDANVLQYVSADGERTLAVTLSKAELYARPENLKLSKIGGASLLLAASDSATAPMYRADLCEGEIYLSITACGMDEQSFINIIREIVQLQNFG